MEGVEVAEPQEEEEAREPGESRDEHRLPRPVQAAADAEQRQPDVHHPDRDHRPGQGDTVVRHESQQTAGLTAANSVP